MNIESDSAMIFYDIIRDITRRENCNHKKAWRKINIYPRLSFAFPKRSIEKLEYDEKTDKYNLEVNFLGLYGALTPLPPHYTLDLFEDEQDDKDDTKEFAARHFFDLLNKKVYQKYYLTEANYRIRRQSESNRGFRQILELIAGKLNIDSKGENLDLRYIDIFAQKIKSKSNFEKYIKRLTKHSDIKVQENLSKIYNLKSSELCKLGVNNSILSENLYLGKRKKVNSTKIAIEVKISSLAELKEFFSKKYQNIVKDKISYFLAGLLEYEVVLFVNGDILTGAILNDNQYELGITTIIGKALKNEYYKLKIYDSETRGGYDA